MTVKNGSTLREALTSAGFSRSEVFADEPWLAQKERLYVFVRPDDAVYAHVRVDASDARPQVRELVLSTERRDFYGTHDPSVMFTRYPDGVSVVSARYPRTTHSSSPTRTVEGYLDVIATANPVLRWSHLEGHRELSDRVDANGPAGVAPWIGQLPAEHQELFGYRRTPRFNLLRTLSGSRPPPKGAFQP